MTTKPKRIPFEHPDSQGISISELIAIHQQFIRPHILSNNIGDGFLYATNPIFKNIRDEVLARGFSFQEGDLNHYFSFPLMCLDEIIAAKKIPYRNNFIWLEILAKQKKFTLTELKKMELQFNYLFHESCHFIAHHQFFGSQNLPKIQKNADTLHAILLGEAFANTVECMSALFTEGEIGSYFLDANCHFRLNEKEVVSLLRLQKKYGYAALAKTLMASFLYANYMYRKLGNKEIRQLQKLAGIPRESTAAPMRIGLMLCNTFRTNTTYLHLLKIGFPADLEKLMKLDPVEKILKNQDQFNSLINILCQGLA